MENILSEKTLNLIRNFGYLLGCYFIFFLALGLVNNLFPEFSMDRYQQSDLNRMLQENPVQLILLAVVFAPIIEEGMFRTLIKPSPRELIFFLCSWLLLLELAFFPDYVHWGLKYLFLFLLFIISFLFLKEIIPYKWQMLLCIFLREYYKFVWGLTAIVFGLVHIFNYVDAFEINLVLFLLIVPRIIAGYFFGKIKIENRSIFWPVAMHAMNNSAVLLIVLPKFLFPI